MMTKSLRRLHAGTETLDGPIHLGIGGDDCSNVALVCQVRGGPRNDTLRKARLITAWQELL